MIDKASTDHKLIMDYGTYFIRKLVIKLEETETQKAEFVAYRANEILNWIEGINH